MFVIIIVIIIIIIISGFSICVASAYHANYCDVCFDGVHAVICCGYNRCRAACCLWRYCKIFCDIRSAVCSRFCRSDTPGMDCSRDSNDRIRTSLCSSSFSSYDHDRVPPLRDRDDDVAPSAFRCPLGDRGAIVHRSNSALLRIKDKLEFTRIEEIITIFHVSVLSLIQSC